MRPVHADHEVFTITGHVIGSAGSDKGAFVVAESPSQITKAFADWGFEVTSMASLADVGQSLEILEALASKDPRVGAEEFIDLLPSAGPERRDARHVFTFVGRANQASPDTLQAGFATAPDRQFLTDYLSSMGFETFSTMSYTEARELHDYMTRVACEAEDDASHTINFKDF